MFLIIQPAMGFKMGYWDEPSKAVPFVVAHQSYFFFGGLFLTLSAVIVAPIVLALHERLRTLSPGLIAAGTFFGVVGVAMSLLCAIGQYAEFHAFASLSTAVAERAAPYGSIAYDATNEAAHVCLGLWTLLLSCAVISRGELPRWLAYFGLLVGVGDLLMLVGLPLGMLLSIVWFVAVGVVLMRTPSVAARGEPQAAG